MKTGKVVRMTTPNGYIIESDGKGYFCHVTDVKENEALVFRSGNTKPLTVGDIVKFNKYENNFEGRAINVEVINHDKEI